MLTLALDPAIGGARLRGAWAEARRVGAAVAGPAAVAGVQFGATAALWGRVSAAEFGLFSFALVLLQLSFGIANAVVGTPLSVGGRGTEAAAHRHRCLSANAVWLLLVGTVLPAILALVDGAPVVPFAVLAVAANLRFIARADALAAERVRRSGASDAAYAGALALLIGALIAADAFGAAALAWAMAAANLAALPLTGRGFLRAQLAAFRAPDLPGYRAQVWRQQAGWALGGVTTTELTSNAQAYAVTALGGAATYAPLAFGALFCRPLTIFLTALTQVDRPIFARLRARSDGRAAASLLRKALAAAGLVWAGNLAVALLALHVAKGSIAARGYDPAAMRTVVLLWFAVMLLRALRNPFSTAVQASGAFRALALCSAAAALVSVAAAALFATEGAAWSLAGAMLGEAVLLAAVVRLHRRTR